MLLNVPGSSYVYLGASRCCRSATDGKSTQIFLLAVKRRETDYADSETQGAQLTQGLSPTLEM